jgi:hypothetical protein
MTTEAVVATAFEQASGMMLTGALAESAAAIPSSSMAPQEALD